MQVEYDVQKLPMGFIELLMLKIFAFLTKKCKITSERDTEKKSGFELKIT